MNATLATENVERIPAWFRVVAGLALLWNLFGVAMYLSAVGVFGDPTTGLTEAQRAAADAIPAWIMGAFAIGTWGGLVGSLGLLLGRRWAWPLLLVSLVALLVLEGWIVFLSGALEAHGGLAIPISVSVVAALLVWVAAKARSRGWLR
jgi:hypothetical protein